jgi:hypothetical protein
MYSCEAYEWFKIGRYISVMVSQVREYYERYETVERATPYAREYVEAGISLILSALCDLQDTCEWVSHERCAECTRAVICMRSRRPKYDSIGKALLSMNKST